ncbi:protease modulator HflC [Histidinibacterium aquaticum]|uniref:Protease modulator HflC n=1 Tax=Histidinibacterium aquaticum TaxID=2613962 RepID=A0A5J5GP39_9RHOB|nr:protease modulator HflC [Histidinibacterium aquaticum]KAA9009827.1 protease modulator HflC [Histidinibacterium aquaticum]
MRRSAFLIPILVVAIALLLSSVFIVDEREKGLVLRFGRVVDVKEDPGLAFKVPILDQVVRYDDRILSRDLDPIEVTPLDDRRLVVDAFARYRITDVERFRQAVGAGGQEAAARRLDSILRAETREVLGQVSSNDILSVDRAELMLRIRNGAIEEADAIGVSIIDVRLKRTDLPPANLNATFERMISEREREAADEIARGNEAAQRTRASADRTVVELVSDAGRQSEIIRGEADAQRNSIYAEAFGADPEFFEFYRSMTAYGRALQSGNTRMLLSPNSEFFTYLREDNPRQVDLGAAAQSVAEQLETLELDEEPVGETFNPDEGTLPPPESPVNSGDDAGTDETDTGEDDAPAAVEVAPESEG